MTEDLRPAQNDTRRADLALTSILKEWPNHLVDFSGLQLGPNSSSTAQLAEPMMHRSQSVFSRIFRPSILCDD